MSAITVQLYLIGDEEGLVASSCRHLEADGRLRLKVVGPDHSGGLARAQPDAVVIERSPPAANSVNALVQNIAPCPVLVVDTGATEPSASPGTGPRHHHLALPQGHVPEHAEALWDALQRLLDDPAPPGVLRQLLDMSPSLTALLGRDGRILALNPAGQTLLGHNGFAELKPREWLSPDSADTLNNAVQRQLPEYGSWQAELELRTADGARVPVSAEVVAISAPNGERGWFYLNARDLSASRVAEADIREREALYRRLVDHAPDALLVEVNGVVRFANRAALQLFDVNREGTLVGHTMEELLLEGRDAGPENDVERPGVRIREARPRDGEKTARTLEVAAAPTIWRDQPARQHVLRPLTERHATTEALQEVEDRLADILSSIDNVVWSASVSDRRLLYLNPAAEAIYGRPVDEFYRDNTLWYEAIHPEDRHEVHGIMPRLRSEGSVIRQFRILRPDGGVRWVEDHARLVYNDEGEAIRVDGVSSDITESKRHQARIQHLANFDEQTELPNRNLFGDRLDQALTHARHEDQGLAVLFLGLDRFKYINDSFGHNAGDRLLRSVAERLDSVLQAGDTLARFAGDEFVLLHPHLSQPEVASRLARTVLELFREPFHVNGFDIHVTVSVGISLFPDDGSDRESLMQRAETAMYRAKSEGGNSFEFYINEMSERALERLAIEGALRRAQQRSEFELFYQPQLALDSGQLVGLEALIRWRHPMEGIIPPDRFIPIAEETGLILPIGAWALSCACQQLSRWIENGLKDCRMAVNISPRQFTDPQLVTRLQQALHDSGLPAELLELELTESSVMSDAADAAATLQAIKSLGVAIAMDDFGTGYSSLTYLKRFPIDRVKVDKSFIQGVAQNGDDAAITRAIIGLGHSLGLTVVAEGVEGEAEMRFLRQSRCNEVQGYYIGRPMPAADCEAFMRAGGWLG